MKELNLEVTEYRKCLENSPEIGVTFHVENAFVAEIDKETYNAKLAELSKVERRSLQGGRRHRSRLCFSSLGNYS